MMQTSLLQDRVDEAWPHISDVVDKALKFETGTLIRDVIPVSGRDSGHGTWGAWAVTAPSRRRVATNPPEAVASEHRFEIDYDALESPPLDNIKTWATNARTLELTDLLGRVVAHANGVPLGTPLPPQTVPAGWGQPRFVHWGLPAADVALLAAVAQEKRITVPLAGNVRGLVFRMGGGLSINVGPDMKLGWVPTTDGIELVLVTQVTLINANNANVTAVT